MTQQSDGIEEAPRRRDDDGKIPQWLLIALLGLGSGGAGQWVTNQTDDPRPDPFTGSQARDMEARLREEIHDAVQLHETHGFRVLDGVEKEFRQRTQYIEALVGRIERRLDKMEHQRPTNGTP